MVALLVTILNGCSPPPPSPPPPQIGFAIHTSQQTVINGVAGPVQNSPGISLRGDWITDQGAVTGTITNFIGFTNAFGRVNVTDGRSPAIWLFQERTGPCSGQVLDAPVSPGTTAELLCEIRINTFVITPSYIDLNSPPVVISMSGDGMDATYGMPQVIFCNTNGYDVASTTAPAISFDGTWLQAPTPYLGFLYSGTYRVVVRNVMPNGSLQTIGGAWVDIFGNDPPPPPDPCGGFYPCY